MTRGESGDLPVPAMMRRQADVDGDHGDDCVSALPSSSFSEASRLFFSLVAATSRSNRILLSASMSTVTDGGWGSRCVR